MPDIGQFLQKLAMGFQEAQHPGTIAKQRQQAIQNQQHDAEFQLRQQQAQQQQSQFQQEMQMRQAQMAQAQQNQQFLQRLEGDQNTRAQAELAMRQQEQERSRATDIFNLSASGMARPAKAPGMPGGVVDPLGMFPEEQGLPHLTGANGEDLIPTSPTERAKDKQAEYEAEATGQLGAKIHAVQKVLKGADPATTKAAIDHLLGIPQVNGEDQLMRDVQSSDPGVKARALKNMRAIATAKHIENGESTASEDDLHATAEMIAEYKQPPLTAYAMAHPLGAKLARLIKDLNPNYQASNYPVYQHTEQDAATGKIAAQAGAFSVVSGHLNNLHTAVKALNNGDVQLLNKLGNLYGVQTGQSAPAMYDTIVHRIGPELTKAYVGAGGTVEDRFSNEADFGRNLSPQQIEANIGISKQLLDTKRAALQQQYDRGTFGRGKMVLFPDLAAHPENAPKSWFELNAPGGAPAPNPTDTTPRQNQ